MAEDADEDHERRLRDEVARLIEHARSIGIDPALALKLRFGSDPFHTRGRKSPAHPQGVPPVRGICEKYRLPYYEVVRLLDAGMPSKRQGRAILIREADFLAWRKELKRKGEQ